MPETTPLATVVLRGVGAMHAPSRKLLLALRQQALEALAARIIEPRRTPVLAGAARDGSSEKAGATASAWSPDRGATAVIEDQEPIILSATGSIVVPVNRLRPEFRVTNDECWVIVGAKARGGRPEPPEGLPEIGLSSQCRQGSGVLVGMIDSGFDPNLPESDGAGVDYFGVAVPGRDIEVRANPLDFHYRHGNGTWHHGTRVGARIAGQAEGVAPKATLAVAAALTDIDEDGRPACDVSQVNVALQWLVTNEFRGGDRVGCDVINASLSVETRSDEDRRGLRFAFSLAGANQVLIVCAVPATENYYRGHIGPLAANPSTLAVGALDLQGRFAGNNTYSIKRQKPEVCAPGSSTSFATPLVTGACALLLEADPALRENAQLLKQRLLDTFTRTPVPDIDPLLKRGYLWLDDICGDPAKVD